MDPGDALGPIFQRNDGSEDSVPRSLKLFVVICAALIIGAIWAVIHFDFAGIMH